VIVDVDDEREREREGECVWMDEVQERAKRKSRRSCADV
jgi:hypothetical protein